MEGLDVDAQARHENAMISTPLAAPDAARRYKTLTLDQPWGNDKAEVRIFPPCIVKKVENRGGSVTVFREPYTSGRAWRRETVYDYGFFPYKGFVAWDESNQEYAWHEVGTIHVPGATAPSSQSLPQPGKPSMNLLADAFGRPSIIRGETETLVAGAGRIRSKRPWRERFMDWFTSKSSDQDPLDFLKEPK